MKLEELGLSYDAVQQLKRYGCSCVEDLTKLTLEELNERMQYAFQVRYIRRVLHENGMCLKNEYDGLNISMEDANVKLEDLVDLDKHIVKMLQRSLYIYTWGELLTTDYEEILKARNIGEHYMEVLKEYVHKRGYVLLNEEKSLREILIQKRKEGVQLLEEVIDSPRIYLILYKNGIYSVEDLINYGPKVLELPGYGPLRRKELIERMKELGIEFRVDTVMKVHNEECVPTKELVDEVRRSNKEIKDRIEHKSALLLEYEELLEERKDLLAKEKELDDLIQNKLSELGGISYVKK